MTVAGITFHSPFWLYITPLILIGLALLFAYASRQRNKQIAGFASERLLIQLLPTFSPQRHKAKQILVFLGLTSLLLTMARPQFGYEWRETQSRGIDIIFAFDVSRSMLAEDIRPNRLQRAKLDMLDFIGKLEGDRIGLVAFAGDAFLMCPLTLDYNAFRQSLMAADTHTISMGGTDIARAIHESEAAFGKNNNHKIIVLISDGEDLGEEGIRRARQAADNGVIIYTVGVGNPEGSLIPIAGPRGTHEYLRDAGGEPVHSRLDEVTLQAIAEVTNGFYVPLGSTGRGLEQVYEAGLKSIPRHELSSKLEQAPLERFQIPLAAALIFLAIEPLFGTRKRLGKPKTGRPERIVRNRNRKQTQQTLVSLAGAMAFILLLSPARTEAATPSPRDARQHYNQGVQHYLDDDFESAEKSFSQALDSTNLRLTADAFYNLGNTHFQLGKAALAEVPSADDQKSGFNQAQETGGQALQHGNALLARAAPNRIPPNLRSPETEAQVVPQDEIKQALQIAEQAKESVSELQESSNSWANQQQLALASWDKALKHYNSALELAHEGDDARKNSERVNQHHATLKELQQSLQVLKAQNETRQNKLELLIEELKKLLEDEENEDGEDGQDGEDSQDGENKQDSQDGEDGQDSENGEDKQESRDSEDGEDSQDGQDGQNDENKQDEKDKQDGQDGEEGQDGENRENEDGAQDAENGAHDESTQQDGAPEVEQDAGAAEETEGAEQEGEALAFAAEMTEEEARQLLDSLRGNERKLPFSGHSPQPHMQDNHGRRKDW